MIAVKNLLWVIVIFNMCFIFYMSSQPQVQSNNLSVGITEKIINTLPQTKDLPEDKKDDLVQKFNSTVRKNAHFWMYFILGALTLSAMQATMWLKKFKQIYIFALAFCLIYAISDEVHQLFVQGRGCQWKDVLIDFGGSFLGVTVSVLIGFFGKMIYRARFDL